MEETKPQKRKPFGVNLEDSSLQPASSVNKLLTEVSSDQMTI
jgi:hypothetical protein